MARLLKSTVNGGIYGWSEDLAAESHMVEISEEQAYPESFIPEGQTQREPKVNLETKDIPEPPFDTDTPISHDASRGLPRQPTKANPVSLVRFDEQGEVIPAPSPKRVFTPPDERTPVQGDLFGNPKPEPEPEYKPEPEPESKSNTGWTTAESSSELSIHDGPVSLANMPTEADTDVSIGSNLGRA